MSEKRRFATVAALTAAGMLYGYGRGGNGDPNAALPNMPMQGGKIIVVKEGDNPWAIADAAYPENSDRQTDALAAEIVGGLPDTKFPHDGGVLRPGEIIVFTENAFRGSKRAKAVRVASVLKDRLPLVIVPTYIEPTGEVTAIPPADISSHGSEMWVTPHDSLTR